MPNNKSTYLETAIVNTLFRGGSLATPSGTFLALYTVMSSNRSIGGTEVSGAGTAYARQAVTWGAPLYAGDGSVYLNNSSIVNFPVATSGWGTVVGFGVYDDPSSGNLLYFGTLASPLPINAADQLTFSIGALTISES